MTQKIKQYRRNKKTNYHKRISLLKSRVPRLVVRISSKNITAQVVQYLPDGDKVLFATSTKSLEKMGWKGSNNSIPSAYLLGFLLASKVKKLATHVILDLGQRQSVTQSRIYAVVKGAVEGGLEIPVDEAMLPSEDRALGKHTDAYATKLAAEDKSAYETRFSGYIKRKLKPETLSQHVTEIKGKITGA